VVVRSQHEVGSGTIRVEVGASRDGKSATKNAVATVIDAFGAGDVAAAAFLSHLLVEAPLEEAVAAATAASAYMYTLPGDSWVRPPDGIVRPESMPGRIVR
ncbi:MAG: PfkB family carbohydrate kinase, partial [Acidimicrobiales bacterium]